MLSTPPADNILGAPLAAIDGPDFDGPGFEGPDSDREPGRGIVGLFGNLHVPLGDGHRFNTIALFFRSWFNPPATDRRLASETFTILAVTGCN